MANHTVEIYVAMNECGDWIVNPDSDSDAHEQLSSDMGGAACRVVKLTFTMSAPTIEEVSIEVPDTAGRISAIESE